MFRQEGPARSERQNQLLAGYLALIGGFVNSAGFVLVGTFTSHATGNVGRLSVDLATGQPGAAGTALTMVSAFFGGAFVTSMIVESNLFGVVSISYSIALFGEASLLFLFTAAAQLTRAAHPRILDLEAAILCGAMGMQNSLVTRLSGALVRTTHLTGVLTDLGIEAARWFRWWRSTLAKSLHVPLSFGKAPAQRPAASKSKLLLTIAGSFTAGAVLGAVLGGALQQRVMLLPAVAVLLGGLQALRSGRRAAPAPLDERP